MPPGRHCFHSGDCSFAQSLDTTSRRAALTLPCQRTRKLAQRFRARPCSSRPLSYKCASIRFENPLAKRKDIKKVVLAYSGGLDTSIILKWLQETYGCAVVTFTADLGQGEELAPARKKAEMLGIKEIFVEDLRETFVRDFVFPMFRANALYEGVYLLGTSIARPLIAKRQIEIA